MTVRTLVLTVEDNSEQSRLLRLLLEREGFDVYGVADAESAIAAFGEICPSLAIIDLGLPGITGAECSREIRARFPECRIVISSVRDPEDYPESDAALPKPITGASLRQVLVGLAA